MQQLSFSILSFAYKNAAQVTHETMFNVDP